RVGLGLGVRSRLLRPVDADEACRVGAVREQTGGVPVGAEVHVVVRAKPVGAVVEPELDRASAHASDRGRRDQHHVGAGRFDERFAAARMTAPVAALDVPDPRRLVHHARRKVRPPRRILQAAKMVVALHHQVLEPECPRAGRPAVSRRAVLVARRYAPVVAGGSLRVLGDEHHRILDRTRERRRRLERALRRGERVQPVLERSGLLPHGLRAPGAVRPARHARVTRRIDPRRHIARRRDGDVVVVAVKEDQQAPLRRRRHDRGNRLVVVACAAVARHARGFIPGDRERRVVRDEERRRLRDCHVARAGRRGNGRIVFADRLPRSRAARDRLAEQRREKQIGVAAVAAGRGGAAHHAIRLLAGSLECLAPSPKALATTRAASSELGTILIAFSCCGDLIVENSTYDDPRSSAASAAAAGNTWRVYDTRTVPATRGLVPSDGVSVRSIRKTALSTCCVPGGPGDRVPGSTSVPTTTTAVCSMASRVRIALPGYLASTVVLLYAFAPGSIVIGSVPPTIARTCASVIVAVRRRISFEFSMPVQSAETVPVAALRRAVITWPT